MAIDSAAKRQSAAFFGCPIFPQTLIPDGVISTPDRQDLVWQYRGIAASEAEYTTLSVESVSITDYDVDVSITDYDVTPTAKYRID